MLGLDYKITVDDLKDVPNVCFWINILAATCSSVMGSNAKHTHKLWSTYF